MPPCGLPSRFLAKTEAPDVQAGFERTSIGDLPIDWVVDQLSTNWEVIDCKHITADFISSGIPVVSIGEVQGRFVDIERAKHTSPSFYSRLIEGGRKPRPGDLILSRNATVGEVAQVAHWHPPFAMGQDVCLLRKRFPDYSSDFLQSIFQSDIISRQLDNLMVGSTFRRVNVQQVKGLVIPFPRSVEQSAIAAALSDVDELLRALEALIAKKRAIKQGAMQELLTGKTRLPGFGGARRAVTNTEIGDLPADWRVIPVKEMTRGHKQGYFTKDQYVNDGVRLVRITDLLNPHIDYDSMPMLRLRSSDRDLYRIRVGDFLFARSGAIGRYGIVDEDVDAIFGSYIIRFTFDSAILRNEFFGYLYETNLVWKQLLSITQGSSNININAANIKCIQIPLPTIAEQNAIVSVLSDMDAEIAALEAQRYKTRAVKQGMMQQLLTGRIRLVKPQPAEADA